MPYCRVVDQSPVIAEADDRSDGIYAPDTGDLIAQGEFGLPVFVGTMQHSTAELIRLIREGRAGAGRREANTVNVSGRKKRTTDDHGGTEDPHQAQGLRPRGD